MQEILIGLIAGIVSGIGMGGGTILILFLSLFMGIDQHIAQATNLVFFIPTAIAAIIINFKQKYINLKLGIWIGFLGMIGAILGAIVSDQMNVVTLRKWFGIFLAIIAIREIYSLIMEYKKRKKRHAINDEKVK